MNRTLKAALVWAGIAVGLFAGSTGALLVVIAVGHAAVYVFGGTPLWAQFVLVTLLVGLFGAGVGAALECGDGSRAYRGR